MPAGTPAQRCPGHPRWDVPPVTGSCGPRRLLLSRGRHACTWEHQPYQPEALREGAQRDELRDVREAVLPAPVVVSTGRAPGAVRERHRRTRVAFHHAWRHWKGTSSGRRSLRSCDTMRLPIPLAHASLLSSTISASRARVRRNSPARRPTAHPVPACLRARLRRARARARLHALIRWCLYGMVVDKALALRRRAFYSAASS